MITLTEKPKEEDYAEVVALYQGAFPERKLTNEQIIAAFEGSTYNLFAYLDAKLAGFVRVISDNLEWTLLTDLAVFPTLRGQGIGSALVRKVLEVFHGHEIFAYTFENRLEFFENKGFRRSKNAFTYAGDEGEYLTGFNEEKFYLPLGYRYESEFYPFAGAFPVGKKSSLDLSTVNVEYTSDASRFEPGKVNALLTKAFGGEDRDVTVTKKAFEESRYLAFAYAGDTLVGCARAESDGVAQALILNVAVDPDYQGLHIGQNVVNLLASQMKGQNLFLNTHPGGVGFYNRKPYRRNKTALIYPSHPDWPEEIAKGFILPKGYRFADELGN